MKVNRLLAGLGAVGLVVLGGAPRLPVGRPTVVSATSSDADLVVDGQGSDDVGAIAEPNTGPVFL